MKTTIDERQRNRQFALLAIGHYMPPFVGMGLFPILSLYARQLGATHAMVGLYYAAIYLASLLSVMVAGRLAPRFSPRRLYVAGAMLGVPALVLLGQATALWQVVLLSALAWFSGGFTITLLSVLAGLLTTRGSQGRIYSLTFLAYPVGSVVGGTVVGQLVAHHGYAFMFAVLGVLWIVLPLLGLLGLSEQPLASRAPAAARRDAASPRPGGTFGRLLLAALLAAIAVNISRLSVSLTMAERDFSAGAIASTSTVSGMMTIPVALMLGTLSDRLGHRRVLMLNTLLAVGGALLLIGAARLWHFQLAATLLFVAWCTNGSVSSALAASELPPEALSRGLPRLRVMDRAASIVGFAAAGFLADALGCAGTYGLVMVLAAVALPLGGAPLSGRWRRRVHLSRLVRAQTRDVRSPC